jgi:PAS domain S-box-containing protein
MNPENDLFLLMLRLSLTNNRDKLIASFIQGLNEVFYDSGFRYSENQPQDPKNCFEINTGGNCYGYITSEMQNADVIKHMTLITGTISILAIYVSKIDLTERLENEKNSYKQFAESKVEELENTIKDLNETRTASINLIEDLSTEIEKRTAAEKEIAITERYFRALIEKASDGVVLIGKDGRMIYASPAAKRIFEYSEDDNDLPDPMENTHPEDLSFVLGTLDNIIREPEKGLTIEYRFRKKDLTYKWVESTFTNLFDEEGVEAIVINFRDISRRKEVESALRESEELYRLVSENGSDVIWLYSIQENKFKYISPSVEQLSGFPVEEVFKMTMQESMTPESFQMIINDLPVRMGKLMAGDESAISQTNEVMQICRDGKILPCEAVTTLILGPDKQVTQIQGVTRDISERKKAEAVLYQRFELQDQIAKIALIVPGMIFSFRLRPDGSACMPFCTPLIEDIWGLCPEDVFEDFTPALSRVHPDDFKRVSRSITESARTMEPWIDTFRLIHPQKGEVWIEGNSLPRLEADGSILWHGFVQDVTVRKKTEIVLQDSERRYRDLVQNANSAIIRWDRYGMIKFFNEYAERFFGYTSSEVIGRDIGILVPQTESSGRDLTNFLKDIMESPENYTNQVNENICRDGKLVWMAWTNKPILDSNGRVSEILAVGIDITDRVRAEEKLRESEERFSKVFMASSVGINIFRMADFVSVETNDAFLEISGYPREEIIGHTSAELKLMVNPLPREIWMEAFSKKQGIHNQDSKIRCKSGEIKDVLASIDLIDINGVTMGMIMVSDIDDRKKAEAALKESERKFRETIMNLDEGYYSCTLDGIFLEHNVAFNRIMGIDTSLDLRGTKLPDFWLALDLRDDYFSILQREGSVSNYPIHIFHGEEERVTLANSHIVMDEEDRPLRVEGTILDITERVQAQKVIEKLNEELEQRVRQRTSQLETVNNDLESFSYSVSHDLRAPLRAISIYTTVLREDYGKYLDENGKKICNIIETSAGQMGKLIDDLLTFSRVGREELIKSAIDMNMLVGSVFHELTTQEERDRICWIVNDLPPSFGDMTTLKQAVTNLISNAIKYSSRIPKPVIEAGSKIIEDERVYYIRDNGIGFNMDYVHMLFGVFQRLHSSIEFEGNGVGLAIVQRIINRHGGRVWAEGEPDKGATFYFSLPTVAPAEISGQENGRQLTDHQ